MLSPAHTFRRISAALMLSTSLTVAVIAISPRAEAKSDVEFYIESDLTYCDAKLYAAFWKTEITVAKAQIGEKIRRGMRDAVDEHVGLGRQLTSCDWADTMLTYDDAETLAKAYGLPNASEAKDKIAYLYTQGRSAEVTAALAAAGPSPTTQAQQQAWDAFQASDFTYCDAKLVGAAWSIDIDQAKAEIGYKILGGYPENVSGILAEGRQTTQCEFIDTLLAFEDAEKLASIWGVDVSKAKDKAAKYYTNGESAVVLGALGVAPGTPASGPVSPPEEARPSNPNEPAKNEN